MRPTASAAGEPGTPPTSGTGYLFPLTIAVKRAGLLRDSAGVARNCFSPRVGQSFWGRSLTHCCCSGSFWQMKRELGIGIGKTRDPLARGRGARPGALEARHHGCGFRNSRGVDAGGARDKLEIARGTRAPAGRAVGVIARRLQARFVPPASSGVTEYVFEEGVSPLCHRYTSPRARRCGRVGVAVSEAVW